jgi:aminoglycoside phosphotransferase (APT) family kinase protein
MYAIFPYIQNGEHQPKTTEEKNKLIEDLGGVLGQIHATPMSASAPQLRKTLGYEIKSKDQSIKQLKDIQKLIEDKPTQDDYDVKALS